MKILIAGASGGIGKYLAEQFSEKGFEVFGTYNSHPPKQNLKYKMDKVDVTKEPEIEEWINNVANCSDELSFIYCVGLNYNCITHKAETDKWLEVINTNLIGAQLSLKHILPLMRNKRYGRIILFSSVVPQIGVSGTSAYSSSKAGLWGLTKTVAIENATYGITINTVNLGYFDIGMIKDVPTDLLNKIINSIPIGKLGDPVNILKTVEYLIATDYITGSQINLNGGLY
ncbi:MAG: SDR family oxidoreductase [Candidatus Cloacimonas sp.]|uniref:Beta-ketoacyl-acyl-carrier-protein reductase (FabG-like) n=1 Tax=Cloacimonas acidaminovorans (strain Evry) TaxID=459349 RepID=B0VGW5_CLOAI|nr:SDR family oxidoreductase [Candidatus Cloacimonas acidaminovorans]MCK9610613.1 SDR family oxidoreductase [Candidatus Cloacimonas sp.]CAO80574.1 putative beta-ketoacyl-acyl-carrier-protein reductase (fabG-like) [Candidatus Cloacimonas acidaminovorans str. Evry]